MLLTLFLNYHWCYILCLIIFRLFFMKKKVLSSSKLRGRGYYRLHGVGWNHIDKVFKVIFYIPSITFSHTVEEYVFVPKMDISRAEDDFDL